MRKNLGSIAAFDRADESLESFARKKKVHGLICGSEIQQVQGSATTLGRTNHKPHQRPERRECEDHLEFQREKQDDRAEEEWKLLHALVRSVNFIIGQRRQGLFHLPEANNHL
jgi:hypothetical protein